MIKGVYTCEKCGKVFNWCAILKKNIKYGNIVEAGICEGEINAEAEQIATDRIRVKARCPKCGHENVFEKES